MKPSLIHTSWNILSQKGFAEEPDAFACLAGLQDSFSFFKLGNTPICSIDTNRNSTNLLNNISPSFKNLTEDILLELRLSIYQKREEKTLGHWSEKLLRFCELRMAKLKEKLIEKVSDQHRVRVFALQLVSFFLDEHFRTGDYRFLNTALKLQDLGWLYRDKDLPGLLKAHPTDHPIPLLHFRILLSTEFALSKINQHGKTS